MVQATPKAQAPDYEDDPPLIPIDDTVIREPVFHRGPFIPEEPIPALLIQGIPPQEEDAYVDDAEMDLADPVENLEDPPVIIASDDDEEIEEEQEEQEEDPEEILFDDNEWDVDSEVFLTSR